MDNSISLQSEEKIVGYLYKFILAVNLILVSMAAIKIPWSIILFLPIYYISIMYYCNTNVSKRIILLTFVYVTLSSFTMKLIYGEDNTNSVISSIPLIRWLSDDPTGYKKNELQRKSAIEKLDKQIRDRKLMLDHLNK